MDKTFGVVLGITLILSNVNIFSQENDSVIVKMFFDKALTDYSAYRYLDTLCHSTKGRVTGSKQAEKAVNYMKDIMINEGFDSVFVQEVFVPKWERGKKETGRIFLSSGKSFSIDISALGMSVGTPSGGIKAEVVEVKNLKDLDSLGADNLKGKIVFFNRPMDPELINTFAAYGGAVDQRVNGAVKAAEFGAVGVVVRSITTALDNFPHTGVLRYSHEQDSIPAVAISTLDAELLSGLLLKDKKLKVSFKTYCKYYGEVISHNVIGEIRGTEKPEKIIVVGGHLDAWDTGEGAHDDGAGCIQSVEVLRLFRSLGIKPRHTIRAVMFMDEEIAQRGGKAYAKLDSENHIFALESDRGGLLPKGFGFSGPKEKVEKMISYRGLFEQYNCDLFTYGGGGVDIGPLMNENRDIVLSSLVPDCQRYFDYHHSPNDVFSNVSFRELQLGSAAIGALIYLVDKNE